MTSVEMPPAGRDPVDAAAREDLRGLFELETVHRRGPASVVFLARDLEFDQPVALKLIPRAPVAGAEAEEAFHRAAALLGDGGKARRAKYRAPEQLSEGRCGPEADQHALAAVMQACLVKTPARIPPDIGRALQRALTPTPEVRFPSVRDFVAALGGSGARPLSGARPPLVNDDDEDDEDDPAFAPQPSRWRWIPAGVLTLVVLGAVAAPWL